MTVVILGDDLAAYIAAHIAGVTEGTNLFVGRMDDKPDANTVLSENAGGPSPITMSTLPKVDTPNLQVHVRDPDYVAGYTRMQAIYALLHGLVETSLRSGGAYIHSMWGIQSPVHLGRDANQRHEWVTNFHCEWENPNR